MYIVMLLHAVPVPIPDIIFLAMHHVQPCVEVLHIVSTRDTCSPQAWIIASICQPPNIWTDVVTIT